MLPIIEKHEPVPSDDGTMLVTLSDGLLCDAFLFELVRLLCDAFLLELVVSCFDKTVNTAGIGE